MKSMRKGISPLVAAVLLIAATMTIAGILTYWATGYVKKTLPEVNETETQCRFGGADFRIYQCSYNASGSKLTLVLDNIRSIELRDLRVFAIYPNGSSSYDINETLPGGMLKTFYIPGVSPDFSKILVKTQCAEVNAETNCK